jgi:import receptor subunit TOM20
MKKGDEVTVAYVDVNQHESESIVDARRRRRIELARGWKFACGCEKCEEEGKELDDEEKSKGVGVEDVKEGEDLSKVVEGPRI